MVVLALGFGVFLLSTLLLVQHNLLRDLRVDRGAARPNLVFFDVQPDQRDDVRARVTAVGPLDRARRADRADADPVARRAGRSRSCSRSRTSRSGRSAGRCAASTAAATATRRAASERVVAGAWWRPGEWKGRADGPVPIAVDAGLARELRLGAGRRGRVGRPGRHDRDARRVPARGGVGALRAQLLRRVPRGTARRRAAQLRAARARRGRRARGPAAARRGRGAPERLDARPRRRSSARSRACSTRSCWRSASWRSSASPPGRWCWRAPSPRAATSACARARCCARWARARPQLVRILLAEYAVLGALSAAGGAAALDRGRLGARALRVRRARSRCRARSSPALVASRRGAHDRGRPPGSTEVWRRPPLEVLRAE